MFSKGNQLKIKLANLKFSKIGHGPVFIIWERSSNRGKGLIASFWDRWIDRERERDRDRDGDGDREGQGDM